jgi:glutathione S-transferase
MKPVATRFARISHADDASVRRDLELLPGNLDRVDAWIAEGTIGALRPNAADFQIATTLRAMLVMDDLRPAVEGRPGAELARRILPDFPGNLRSVLPPGWAAPDS